MVFIKTSFQVMHGGLFSKDDVKIADIKAIDRNRQPPESGQVSLSILMEPFYQGSCKR